MVSTRMLALACSVPVLLLTGLSGDAQNGYGYGNASGTPATYGGYGTGANPYSGYPPLQQPQQPAQANQSRVSQWFSQYDQIRRDAQMPPAQRQMADQLLSRGMSILMPGPEKEQARNILSQLVNRYQRATAAIKQLPMIPETKELHRGYYQYFNNAQILFTDYLRVQDNVFVVDQSTGKPIAGQLIQRKTALEQLNQQIQSLDNQLRAQFGIPAYQYQTGS